MFEKYEWNNMLHNQVEKIIGIILDSNYDELKRTVTLNSFEDGFLLI